MQLAQTGKLPAQYLHYLVNAVAGLQLNVNATWAWLTGPAGMAVPAAAAIMAPVSSREGRPAGCGKRGFRGQIEAARCWALQQIVE